MNMFRNAKADLLALLEAEVQSVRKEIADALRRVDDLDGVISAYKEEAEDEVT